MFRSLHVKFLLLLLGVAALALSGTIVFRELVLRDFGEYLEGNAEDKVYWVLADLESGYERNSGWRKEAQAQDALWALTLGFDIRLLDEKGNMIIDTAAAIESASPLARRRLDALSRSRTEAAGDFVPYPLFLAGKRIGTLEAKVLRPANEQLFLRRADRFLLFSVVLVGGLSLLVSMLFSRRLTRPIKSLALAASAIRRGDLGSRVVVARRDEVGELGGTFNRMADALETQDRLRRKLIADVAHELRTPLAAMRCELEGMMDGLIPDDEKRLLSLYDETGRLKRMVEGIEELSRAEASTLSLRRQQVPLKPFLAHIVDRFAGPFAEKGVALELAADGDPELYADPERLSQIVLNLLDNALKATGEGGRVRVSAVSVAQGVEIIVADNGKGISEADLPFVFERFYRGAAGGLGIGLTIVKELVCAHGGSIDVKSGPGPGSSFIILFPTDAVHNSS